MKLLKITITMSLMLVTSLLLSQTLTVLANDPGVAKPADQHYLTVQSWQEGRIANNQMVAFRFLEEVEFNESITIPKNTMFYAVAEFLNGRVYFSIDKLEIEDKVYNFPLIVIDKDLRDGLAYSNRFFIQKDKYRFRIVD